MDHSDQTTTLRIASYNMRKARGLDRRRDPARILRVINDLGAAVVALQEADFRLGDRPAALPVDLITRETDFRVAPVARTDVSLGWHGNAVLVHKSLDLGAVARIDLPGLEPRGAVRVDLGNGVSVIATHLGLMRASRRRQLATIAAAVPEGARTVIAGDFNEWHMRRGLEPLSERFEVLAPGRSFHAARPVAALDRFAVTRDLRVASAGVHRSALAHRASDHLPVWVELDVPARAGVDRPASGAGGHARPRTRASA